MILVLRDYPARPGHHQRSATSRYRKPPTPSTYGRLMGAHVNAEFGFDQIGGEAGSPCSMQDSAIWSVVW